MNMKLSDYIAQNGDREVDSEKLDEVLQIKRSKVWKPERGEIYWYTYSNGKIDTDEWINDENDIARWEMGNVFPTEEAAQAYVEYLKTTTALKRYAQEHNEGEIDWYDGQQPKSYITFRFRRDEIYIYGGQFNTTKSQGVVYFTSKEIAQAAIDEIGEERIKRYLLYEG